MKLFISWSGENSSKVANIFKQWLPLVISIFEKDIFISTEIPKGERWSREIESRLISSSFGLICVTRDNMEAPWLNFEAGALSKSIDPGVIINNKVSPFLFGLEPQELSGPLTQFQAVRYEKEDINRLVKDINKAKKNPESDKVLDDRFKQYWPKLFKKLEKILPLVQKKIIWAHESGDINIFSETNQLIEKGYKNHVNWQLNEDKKSLDQDCDILIYIYKKSEESKQYLRKIVDFLAHKKILFIVYTHYAAGNGRLEGEDEKIFKEAPNSVMANMPSTLIEKFK